MSKLISRIHSDHQNMARVLKLIVSEIDAMASEEPRELILLDDAMRYMINYVDEIHHPKEDLIFNRMRILEVDQSEHIEDILDEHQALFTLGSQFQELVQAAEYGDFVLRQNLVEQGRAYVNSMYSHMRKEEDEVFQKAKQILSDEELAALDREVEHMIDPVFGEYVQQEYKALYDYVLDQYGEDWRDPAHRVT